MKRKLLAVFLIAGIQAAHAVNFFGTQTRKPRDVGNGSPAFTIDWSRSPSQLVTLNGSTATATFIAPGGNGSTSSADLNLTIIPGGAGINGAITWPAAVKWASNGAPAISNGNAAGVDLVKCHYNGTSYLCDSVLNAY